MLEIPIENAPVDRGERCKVDGRNAFVDLVHGLVDEAELDHWAIILDETRVRRAAGGRELRRLPGHLGNRARDEIDERTGRGEERVGVRGLPVDTKMPTRRRGAGARLDQRLERSLAVVVVEADVEARARLA